jgi:membrane-associated phospholipid phosphatase
MFLDILGTLYNLDKDLFILIHSEWSSSNMDWLFKALRNALTWVPLYIFVLFWILRFHRKNALPFILLTLVTFAITDHTSAAIMKPFFHRLRPCFDPSLDEYIRTVVTCGGKYGMPSTHASNHFGLASFWFFSLLWMGARKWYWLWIWALLIGYAQVYVGKHYPGDILVGALLGTVVGFLLALFFRRWTLNRSRRQNLPAAMAAS